MLDGLTTTTPAHAGTTRRRLLVLLSPLVVIAVGHLVARVGSAHLGVWAWVPVAVAYWGLMAAVVLVGTTPGQRRGWFGAGTRRPWWVVPVALVLGLGPVAGILLLNLDLLGSHAHLVVPWLLFALVNPVLEETYWRGALQDATAAWPAWVAALSSTVLFVASHPLQWGVFSEGNRSPMLYGSLLLMGVAWFAMRRATGSLRWPLVSHFLVDVGNLSVFVFVNAYVPPVH